MSQPEQLLTWKMLRKKYLDLRIFDSARFYAERAWYDDPNDDNLYALAETYFLEGKTKQAYLILTDVKHGQHSACKFMLAQCCVSLGKLEEAESLLLPHSRFVLVEQMTKDVADHVPGGASGLFLMGRVCKRQQRFDVAEKCFQLAIQVIQTK